MRKSGLGWLFVVVGALATTGATGPGEGGDAFCGVIDAAQPAVALPASGLVKVALVPVEFTDNNRPSYNNNWPAGTVPAWLTALGESLGVNDVPSVPGSLSHVMYAMSRGNLVVSAKVHPNIVSLEKSLATYYAENDSSHGAAQSAAMRDALDSLSVDTSFSFADYVNLGPGQGGAPDSVDYVIFLFRGMSNDEDCDGPRFNLNEGNHGSTGQGFGSSYNYVTPDGLFVVLGRRAAWVNSAQTRVGCSGWGSPGDCDAASTTSCAGGTLNGWCVAQVHDSRDYLMVAAHELMHTILLYNSVVGYKHVSTMTEWDLMSGSAGPPIPGTFIREDLGWLGSVVSVPAGTNQTVTLYESLMDGFPSYGPGRPVACRIETGVDSNQYWLVEYRGASTVYDQSYALTDWWTIPGTAAEGLLVTHVNRSVNLFEQTIDRITGLLVSPVTTRWTLNVEPGGGLWSDVFEPHPEVGEGFAGLKLFDPGLCHYTAGDWSQREYVPFAQPSDVLNPGDVFSPYTCPSTAAYSAGLATDPDDQTVPTGMAIQNVRNNGNGSMTFDVVWNQSATGTSGNVTWGGQVLLTEDFRVGDADTLTIESGARILARGAGTVSSGGTDKVGVAVEGIVHAARFGGSTGPLFASSRDTSARSAPWDSSIYQALVGSVPTGPAAGDWSGVEMDDNTRLASVSDPGTADLSLFDMAAFRHADFAIGVDSLGPTLLDCAFEDNAVDVKLDGDVRIPVGGLWSLNAPTRVVASDSSDVHDTGDYPGFVEILVDGTLATHAIGSGSADSVWFLSEGESALGSDWRGISVRSFGHGDFDRASVGYAAAPLEFLGATTAQVIDSHVHTFLDIGIFDWASDLHLAGVHVMRGTVTDVERLGAFGVKLYQSAAVVEDSYIQGGGTKGWGGALRAEFTSGFCGSSVPAETLLVRGNDIVGNGTAFSGTGIHVIWGCDHQNPRIEDNVMALNRAAVRTVNSEAAVECNLLVANNASLQQEGHTGDVSLLGNRMLSPVAWGVYVLDAAEGLQMGTAAAPGNNVVQSGSLFQGYTVVDQDTTTTLAAEGNLWMWKNGLVLSGGSTPTIAGTMSGAGAVNWANFLGAEPTFCGQQRALPDELLALVSEEHPLGAIGTVTEEGKEEESPSMRLAGSNPFEGAAVEVQLSLPSLSVGGARLVVYDVVGRRVNAFVLGAEVHQVVRWDGRNAGGASVAAGVYFMRLTVEGFPPVTRKVVLTR